MRLADRIRLQGGESSYSSAEDVINIDDRLANISEFFGISDLDLDSVRHAKHMPKTVRQVTQLVYPDIKIRRTMKISTMNQKFIQAIIGEQFSPRGMYFMSD